jgi:hypothetical protein
MDGNEDDILDLYEGKSMKNSFTVQRRIIFAAYLSLLGVNMSLGFANSNLGELKTDKISIRFGINGRNRGNIASLKTISGFEMISRQASNRLFSLVFKNKDNSFNKTVIISSVDARKIEIVPVENSSGHYTKLIYTDFINRSLRVECTVRVFEGDPMLRFSISIKIPTEWILESVQYPIIVLTVPLGGLNEDDAIVIGSTRGGVIHNISKMNESWQMSISQPGSMAAQFGCYYNNRFGFYSAAEDGQCYPKTLKLARVYGGLEFSWEENCYGHDYVSQEYQIVITTFAGNRAQPTDWRDAADLYKIWALKQTWCTTTYEKRSSIPIWMKEGPAMVRFDRNWLSNPDQISRWLTEYWKKQFTNIPLITTYWGWEKHGMWVAPDYFPAYPSDEQFEQLVSDSRRIDCHTFVWPSGYHWSLTYNKLGDGNFEWDDREYFMKVASTHAVYKKDGTLSTWAPDWLKGGETATLDGADPWTNDWWNEDVCVPLAKRGCEII